MLLDLQTAIARLRLGEAVAIPTETVYGLAARIDNVAAIAQIFKIKNRPFFDPLIVHVNSIAMAKDLCAEWSPVAQALAEAFWPGPLTMVLPKNGKVDGLITAGLDSVGLRWPKHHLAQQILDQLQVPLAAPSANKFGRTSPTAAAHVETEFAGEQVGVLDGGPCQVGLESTVLSVSESHKLAILREGAVLPSDVVNVLSRKGLDFQFLSQAPRSASPGHTQHHYMPSVPLIVCARDPKGDADFAKRTLLRLQQIPAQIEGIQIVKPSSLNKLAYLQLSSDPALAAREFYNQLRELSADQPDAIIFIKPSYMQGEAWAALWNRLSKAATLLEQDLKE